jgi:catalase
MANTIKDGVKTRKIAFLVADGFDNNDLAGMKKALTSVGAQAKVVAPRLGFLTGAKGEEVKVDFSLLTASSVLFDAVYIPGGEKSIAALQGEADAVNFINEAYQHCKSLAVAGAGVELLRACCPALAKITEANGNGNNQASDPGIVIIHDAPSTKGAAKFIEAIGQHRHWSREVNEQVPD